ncbi:hypothetical protein E3P92_03565 [Wallemia ichthyophaga]|uniref:Uncharacterized protein n=2 Tax=Wallemia ichthyophaga TaxID=245174 RepID=A0A4T0H6F7_WALIC|nr:uncharacterized protein J056_002804 [Wallemia ichthyophaga EXF-994]TIA69445.1 hypothetical protein E3P91_03615 [Wallemia ichthyophaga]EOQ98851.1 hypothetical protein J056_002804 [Wallemia ichthyophaga EXF-994]TIA78979.1 hypothetical protein E3P98_03571 [Wallemia ichthyophaga]TIA95905.1 hypothetical protein E3P95_03501 [Wallemia ichthyophaga]TIA96948.1 hypothetical protein E3P94_03508 [Wallemia ichthyophaga]
MQSSFVATFIPQVHEEHVNRIKELIVLYGGNIRHSQNLWLEFEIDDSTLFWTSTKNDPFIRNIFKAMPVRR